MIFRVALIYVYALFLLVVAPGLVYSGELSYVLTADDVKKYSASAVWFDKGTGDNLRPLFEKFTSQVNGILESSECHELKSTATMTPEYAYALFCLFREEIEGAIYYGESKPESVHDKGSAKKFFIGHYREIIRLHIGNAKRNYDLGPSENVCIMHVNDPEQIIYRAAIFSLMCKDKQLFSGFHDFQAELYDYSLAGAYSQAKRLTEKEGGNIKSTSGFHPNTLVNHILHGLMMALTAKRVSIAPVLQNGVVGLAIRSYGSSLNEKAYNYVADYDNEGRVALLAHPEHNDFVNLMKKLKGDASVAWKASWASKVMLLHAELKRVGYKLSGRASN